MATDKTISVFTSLANRQTWLYAPGNAGSFWNDAQNLGVMAIGWEELGDLTKFASKEDIAKELRRLEETEGSKKNDATACWDFVHRIRIGDVVIAKKGRSELLGWGIVRSDYSFEAGTGYPNRRKVDWQKRGIWAAPGSLALKTLTNLTPYPGYPEELLAIISGGRTPRPKVSRPLSDASLNTILFGPPGTGKTYHTVNRALSILQGKPMEALDPDRQVLQEQFRQFQADGRIGFVTFHPSFSYEDFIEGIKPLVDETRGTLKYEIVPGVFRSMATDAAYEYVKVSPRDDKALGFDDRWDQLITEVQTGLEETGAFSFQTRSQKRLMVVRISEKGNLILRHEGATTDRDYTVSLERTKKLFETFPDLEAVENIDTEFRSVIGGSNSSAYWAVLKALWQVSPTTTPAALPEATALTFEQKARKVADLDWSDVDPYASTVKPYVLIIDEINRGNIPAIFGELITLIEDDKRAGCAESLTLILPYSKIAFQVPANLYILGTMNTADRSVEALDAALRRRFTFEAQMPHPSLLPTNLEGVDLSQLLAVLNNRLERLLDRDHTIGHAFLMGITTLGDLVSRFQNKVIPQLQEYFYGDWRKIGMVLGPYFVLKEELASTSWPAGFGDDDAEAQAEVYRISPSDTWSVEAFTSLYR